MITKTQIEIGAVYRPEPRNWLLYGSYVEYLGLASDGMTAVGHLFLRVTPGIYHGPMEYQPPPVAVPFNRMEELNLQLSRTAKEWANMKAQSKREQARRDSDTKLREASYVKGNAHGEFW